jgi:two-component system, OmpR family, flagellar system response regulator FtcR
LTKTQIFNAVYGIFEATFDESVIESHVSKLRKKLRARLGFDAIEARRYLGYRLEIPRCDAHDAVEESMQDVQNVGILLNQPSTDPSRLPSSS